MRTFVDTRRRVLDKVSNLPCFSTSCTVTVAASLLGSVVSSRCSCGLMAAASVTQVNKHGLSGLCLKQAFYKRLGVEGSSSWGVCFNSGRQPEAVSSRYPIYLHHPPKKLKTLVTLRLLKASCNKPVQLTGRLGQFTNKLIPAKKCPISLIILVVFFRFVYIFMVVAAV